LNESLTVKITGPSEDAINEVVEVLESRFIVIATSSLLQSHQGGFHRFVNLIAKKAIKGV